MLGDRETQIQRLANERFDVAVVGGGISGAGIALELAARGQRVALVERADFASGTSSRSSKLVHGGLRYLAQGQLAVTRESVEERGRLVRLAPKLVHMLPFVITVEGGLIQATKIAWGLAAYDLMAAGQNTHPFALMRRVDLKELAPGIDLSRLTVAYVYHDARTDDAQLTLAVLAQAHARGAAIANHAGVHRIVRERSRAIGLAVQERIRGESFDLRADRIVLATGAWGDTALAGDGVEPVARVRPAKGVHLFFPRERVEARVALYLPTGVDSRLVFVVPWHGRTLVGTTDTDYQGPLDRPAAEDPDVDYLLRVLNRAFPGRGLSRDDIVGAQAGLRPLVYTTGPTSRASREEKVWERADGVLVLGGGKLTTYRRTAEKVAQHLLGGAGPSPTASIELAPVPEGGVTRLVRETQAREVGDVLARRTRRILLDHRGAVADAEGVAREMGDALGWTAARRRKALARFAEEAAQYGLPEWRVG